jgi:hypothetical protein
MPESVPNDLGKCVTEEHDSNSALSTSPTVYSNTNKSQENFSLYMWLRYSYTSNIIQAIILGSIVLYVVLDLFFGFSPWRKKHQHADLKFDWQPVTTTYHALTRDLSSSHQDLLEEFLAKIKAKGMRFELINIVFENSGSTQYLIDVTKLQVTVNGNQAYLAELPEKYGIASGECLPHGKLQGLVGIAIPITTSLEQSWKLEIKSEGIVIPRR